MANPEIRKFDGLYLQANSFDVPDGAMEIAENVVIQSDNIVSKTKGFYEFWRPGGGDTLTGIKALYTYQGVLIGLFSNGAGYFSNTFPYGGSFNAVGNLTALGGASFTAEHYAFFAEANQNLYFTANEGIYKLEAYNSPVRKAGVPQGVSLSSTGLVYSNIGILPSNSQTSYRAVFGRRDTNGNLLLGSPSDVVTFGVEAPQVGVSYAIVGGVCTVTLNTANFEGSNVGDVIQVTLATNTALNGTQIIASVTTTTITFTTAQPNSTGTMTVTVNAEPTVVIDIPSEISDASESWFVQLYRTPSSLTVIEPPSPTFKLVLEQVLTTTDILSKQLRFSDTVDYTLLGAELYTNANSREGELQINARPPQANVLCKYKGYMLFSDITTVQRLFMNVVQRPALDSLTFQSGLLTETYKKGVTNSTADAAVTGSGTGSIVITDPSNQPAIGDKFLIFGITGTLLPGVKTITAVSYPTYTISAPGLTMASATVNFVTEGADFIFDSIAYVGKTEAQNLQIVTQELVRSINRNSAFMYANSTSQFALDRPGEIAIQSKGVAEPIYVKRSAGFTEPFIQPLPTSFLSGTQFYSENDQLKNGTLVSKVGENEAVPPLNLFYTGDANSRILQSIPLRDCVVIIKEDGAYKLTGDAIGDFSITPIDTTIEFPETATRVGSAINNVAVCMSNQGVVKITADSIGIPSRRIDDLVQPLVGRDLDGTFLAGNEGDRLFYVNTKGLNDGDADVCLIYNVLNETWTTTTEITKHLAIGPSKETVGIVYDAAAGADVIHKQRKTQTLIDYCGKYAVGTIAVNFAKLSGTLTITGGNAVVPAPGDALLYNDLFTRITASTPAAGAFELSFSNTTNIPTVGTPTVFLMKAYRSTVKMAPFHAGQVGLEKIFSEFQIHLRQAAISDLELSFGGAYFGSSETTEWDITNISSQGSSGWGYAPFGFFPWGLSKGVDLSAGTRSASIIRTYVPRIAARNTFIQTMFRHEVAGQPMLIQSMSFSCRGYGARTTK